MRKMVVFTAVISSVLFAQSFDAKIENTIKEKFGFEIKVISSKELNPKELKVVVIERNSDKQRLPIISTKNGETIFATNALVSTSDENFALLTTISAELEKHNESALKPQMDSLFEKFDDKNSVFLKSKVATKKTIIIVSDPECGYCRNELKELDEKLKEANVRMIFAPVGGESAVKKAQIAMNNIAKAKNDETKIKAIREVYAPEYKVPSSTIDTSLIKKNQEVIFSSGQIKGVPYIYETTSK